jgi:hypothetical protein
MKEETGSLNKNWMSVEEIDRTYKEIKEPSKEVRTIFPSIHKEVKR